MKTKNFLYLWFIATGLFLVGCNDGKISTSDGNNNTQGLEKVAQNIDVESYKGLEDVFSNSAKIESKDKPILIVFGKNNCAYCEKLKNDLKKDEELRDLVSQNFKAYYINTSYSKVHEISFEDSSEVTSIDTDDLARQYKLSGTPLSVWLEPNGDRILSLQGYDRKHFRAMLDFIKDKKYAGETDINKRMELFTKSLIK